MTTSYRTLLEKLNSRSAVIGIIGMGYVGQPLALRYANLGYKVLGFDIDAAKCMYCGLCAEACPTGAIRHTTQFAGATPQIGRLVLRYIGAGEKLTPYKPKTEVADLAPRGSLAAAQLQRCFPEGDRGAK